MIKRWLKNYFTFTGVIANLLFLFVFFFYTDIYYKVKDKITNKIYAEVPFVESVLEDVSSVDPIADEIGKNFLPWRPLEQVDTFGDIVDSSDYVSLREAAKALKEGQTLLIASGVYNEGFFIDASNVTVIGEGHVVLDGGSVGGKAAIVNRGDYNRISNIECKNIRVNDRNGACVRQEGTGLIIDHVYFHDSQQGVLSGVDKGLIEIRNSRLEGLGNGGRAHGVYVSGDKLIVHNTQVLATKSEGHGIKSRARETVIKDSIIANFSAIDSRLVDIPHGGLLTISGSVLEQGPFTANQDAIGYGLEGMKGDNHLVDISNNLIIMERRRYNQFLHMPDGFSSVQVAGNVMISKDAEHAGLDSTNHVFESRGDAGIEDYPFLPKLNP